MLKSSTLALPGNKKSTADSTDDVAMENADNEKEKLIVEAYTPPDPGPYPQDQPRQNSVRFTPIQVLCKSSFSMLLSDSTSLLINYLEALQV